MSFFRPTAGEAGFSLIEVVVTALVVALLAAAVAQALVAQTHTSADQRLRAQAASVGNSDQERLRGLSDQQLANLAGASATRTATVNGTSFTVVSSAGFQDAQGNSSCASTSVDYYKLTTTVSWGESFSRNSPSVTLDSLLSRPVIGAQQTSVTDQTGAPVAGAAIIATPASGSSGLTPQSGVTDSSGCAVFLGMAAGSYTIGATKSGYVDVNGNASPTKSATVAATGNPSSTAFVMGPAGGVTATFTAKVGATVGLIGAGTYTGESNALTYSGTDGTLSGGNTVTSSPLGQPATGFGASNLFPFYRGGSYSNNYTAFGGKCSLIQQPSGYNQFTVNPGQTTTTNIQEPFLYIPAIKNLVGQFVQPADIVLTYSGGSGTSACTDSYKATIAPATASSPFVPATGWLQNPGQPYGTVSVCEDYWTGLAWLSATTSVANTSMTAPNVAGLPASLSLGSACKVST